MQRHINGVDKEGDHFSRSHFWDQDCPDSLVNVCLTFLVKNFVNVFFVNDEHGLKSVNPDISLPPFLFEELHAKSLSTYHPLPMVSLAECLKTQSRFPIRKLDLSQYEELTDEQLRVALGHQLVYLNVDSKRLTQASLSDIIDRAPSLVKLKIGSKCKGFGLELSKPWFNFKLKKLRHLSLNDPDLHIRTLFETDISTENLVILDLSDCKSITGLPSSLDRLRRLEELSLHNVEILDVCALINSLATLKTLRRLDLGRSDQTEGLGVYEGDLARSMKHLLDGLPRLRWLELCGTNLSAHHIDTRVYSERMRDDSIEDPLPWLAGRRLDYIGLLGCPGNPSSMKNIPADKVGGDNDSDQVLVSLETYWERQTLLLQTLNTFFEMVRTQSFDEVQEGRALEYILKAMDKHRNAKDIQLSGSASIFYLMKGSLKSRLTVRIKRHIIRTTLDAMQKTFVIPEEASMCRNGCLILCHFRIPQDLLHDYSRVVTILLRLIEKPEPAQGEPFIQTVSLNLLNSLACQVDNKEKLLVGELGTFEVMLKLIHNKLERGICDEIMEVAWSLMWNATDETAENCERFINNGGLRMFVRCYEAFKERSELLRNMMGLMGNVAEVDHLKHHLITQTFVPTFRDLLDSKSDGIEVSYNSCGILANLMLKGPSSWGELSSYWLSVQTKMRHAMARWPMTSERNINYRSFGPILRLLECHEVAEVQQWALWALCNLTKVYRSKYCPLLKEEKGVDKLLDAFIGTKSALVRKMAAKVIRRCSRFEIHPEEVSDTEEDDLGMDVASGDFGDCLLDGDLHPDDSEDDDDDNDDDSAILQCDSGDCGRGKGTSQGCCTEPKLIKVLTLYQRYFQNVEDKKRRILGRMMRAMKK